MDLKNKHALVYDLGLFTENALRLARDFASVKYFCPWQEAFAEPFKQKIGEGLEGMERIVTFWDALDEADLVFIPDTSCSDITEFLKSHDYPVAGAGAAEKIELDRWYGRSVQAKNGLPVQETHKVKGITALTEFCKEHKDFYIKVDNSFRGISESFKHQDFRSSESRIDYIAYKVGPYKEDVVFICEELLPGVEPGLDGITFDGELALSHHGRLRAKRIGLHRQSLPVRRPTPRGAANHQRRTLPGVQEAQYPLLLQHRAQDRQRPRALPHRPHHQTRGAGSRRHPKRS